MMSAPARFSEVMTSRTAARSSTTPFSAAALIMALATMTPAVGQEHARMNGTVQSITGQSLLLLSDTPLVRSPSILGMPIAPGSAPLPRAGGLYVDLRQLSPAEYGSIRPGDRVTVAGVIDGDGLIATFISLRAGPQSP